MPSFDAGWDFVAQLNIRWPFQHPPPPLSSLALSLYPNSCPPSFSPCCWCHKKISQTDSLEQMVLCALQAFSCALLAIHVHFFPLKSYTSKLDGGFVRETSDEFLKSIVAWAVSHLSAMNGEHAGGSFHIWLLALDTPTPSRCRNPNSCQIRLSPLTLSSLKMC